MIYRDPLSVVYFGSCCLTFVQVLTLQVLNKIFFIVELITTSISQIANIFIPMDKTN